jgi:hypothetical protein
MFCTKKKKKKKKRGRHNKPLNKVLEWTRYPIPNKRDLINRLSGSIIFSKFDMKNGFWQIQIHEKDKYKRAFVTPFRQYE